MKLADWLQDALVADRELADKIGVSVQTIWYWRKDQRRPRVGHLRQLRKITHGKVGPKDFDGKK